MLLRLLVLVKSVLFSKSVVAKSTVVSLHGNVDFMAWFSTSIFPNPLRGSRNLVKMPSSRVVNLQLLRGTTGDLADVEDPSLESDVLLSVLFDAFPIAEGALLATHSATSGLPLSL